MHVNLPIMLSSYSCSYNILCLGKDTLCPNSKTLKLQKNLHKVTITSTIGGFNIMPDAWLAQLCSKLCCYNVPVPFTNTPAIPSLSWGSTSMFFFVSFLFLYTVLKQSAKLSLRMRQTLAKSPQLLAFKSYSQWHKLRIWILVHASEHVIYYCSKQSLPQWICSCNKFISAKQAL